MAVPKTKAKKIKCLLIKARTEAGFRRCGVGFTQEGANYELDLFDENQIEMLKNEPNLMVSDSEIEESELGEPVAEA